MKYSALGFIILLAFCFALPALATQRNVKTGYGAVGDGVHDDTTNINNAVAAMVGGDELYFPCGTYLITSQLRDFGVSNTTVDGQTGCSGGAVAIQASSSFSGSYIWRIISRNWNILPTGGVACGANCVGLTASANELANSFTVTSTSLLGGVSAGDYVMIKEGDTTYYTLNYDGDGMGCGGGGCRLDMLHVASVNGSTITVDTALH